MDMGYETPCRVWQRGISRQGYGQDWRNGTGSYLAHVAAWERANGNLPKGRILHHRCEVKSCIRLDHLEPLTRAEHKKRHKLP